MTAYTLGLHSIYSGLQSDNTARGTTNSLQRVVGFTRTVNSQTFYIEGFDYSGDDADESVTGTLRLSISKAGATAPPANSFNYAIFTFNGGSFMVNNGTGFSRNNVNMPFRFSSNTTATAGTRTARIFSASLGTPNTVRGTYDSDSINRVRLTNGLVIRDIQLL